jgi:HSP20 family protein
MKNEALTTSSPKNIAVSEISLDSLFKEMSEWSDRIAQRAYDLFASSGFINGHDLDHWFKAERELLKPIAVEVKDGGNEFIVTAEVRGFAAKELAIHINGPRLVIEGKSQREGRKAKEGKTVYKERESQQIYRSIELPGPVLADKANAELKNGVLELKLPKAEKALQIKVVAA